MSGGVSECGGNSWGDILDDPCGLTSSLMLLRMFLWWLMCVLAPSLVSVMCEGDALGSEMEFVEPQSFSFFKKRAIACVENLEDMNYEGTIERLFLVLQEG